MVYCKALKKYVPACYILMSGKTSECYWQAFNWLVLRVPGLAPEFVGVDFEIAFFKAAREHFPDAILVGCKFHFKQALRKKMLELGIPEGQIAFAMKKGVLDVLLVIPPAQLKEGVLYVRTKIMDHVMSLDDFDYQCDVDVWDEFFDGYFNS